MTLEEITSIRNTVGDNAIMAIMCDDNVTFFAGPAENYEFIWDDEEKIFYQLRPNMSTFTQVESPIEMTMVSYDSIQYIAVKQNYNDILSFLKSKGKSDEEIKKIIDNLKVFSTMRNTTSLKTDKGYADGSTMRDSKK